MDNAGMPASATKALCRSLVAALVLLGACATQEAPPAKPAPPAPTGFPEKDYLEAAPRTPVYRIDPARSQLLVFIYRDGSLARMGHDHVAASRDVRGYASAPQGLAAARADVYFAFDSLTMDEPALRSEAGFTSEIDAEDIETTRLRMLRLVDAAVHPFARLRVLGVSGTPPSVRLAAELTLRGETRPVELPLSLNADAGTLRVEGEFSVRQTDFGITPFSIFGGALAVKDELRIKFRVEGVRLR
jgi:polyisoprenoid-binding protein YceI